MNPIMINQVALIRQQEILEAAAQDRKVRRIWHTFWTALIPRRNPAPTQPVSLSMRPAKQEAG